MEVAKRFWRGRVLPLWGKLADAFVAFVEEAAFRAVLAFDVLAGRLPRRAERRPWNRAMETPVLVDVRDWTDDRLIFSVLVWPSLESGYLDAGEAERAHRQRIEDVLGVIAKGAADRAWSTYWDVDYGLTWHHERGVWIASDGHAYDGGRLFAYSRKL